MNKSHTGLANKPLHLKWNSKNQFFEILVTPSVILKVGFQLPKQIQ